MLPVAGSGPGGEEQMMSVQGATTLTRPVGELVGGFCEWLVSERRLAANTVEFYVRGARLFLGESGGQDVAGLTLGEVSSFLVREWRRFGVGSAKNLATGLRSLLRYLYLAGVTDRELAQAVPAPASRRGGGLPRGLRVGEVAALLAGCDDSTRARVS